MGSIVLRCYYTNPTAPAARGTENTIPSSGSYSFLAAMMGRSERAGNLGTPTAFTDSIIVHVPAPTLL